MMSERKKILWLVSWYPNSEDPFDGDFIQRHAKAAALYDDIHVVFVKEREQEMRVDETWNQKNGLTEQVIYFKKQAGLFARAGKQLRWWKLFRKAVDAYLKKYGRPDWVHVHVPWKAGLLALQLKKQNNTPYLVTEHSGIYNNVVADRFSSKPIFVKELVRRVFRQSAHYVFVSRFLADAVCQTIASKPVAIVPNTVDTGLFHPSQQKQQRFTFIHVSNMVPLKNVPGILRAFSYAVQQGMDARLVLVGNKDASFEAVAEEAGLLNSLVFFRGEVAYEQVAAEMQQAHCLVLHSVMENSPCVIGEALCCGLPVIAPAVGGIPELVNTSNAILTNGSDEELARAMLQVYHNYDQYNKSTIALNASQRFGFSAVGAVFHKIYHSLDP